MQVVFGQIERIAALDAPVFITGEAGTGKRLAAGILHAHGARADGPLVMVEATGARPEAVEAELFGGGNGGALERASGGMLVLAEIGDIALAVQERLLHFLQTPHDASAARVVCATRHNPMQLVAERRFREDLFYRLHVLPIHLPPLRQRAGDVPLLARHFLARAMAEEHKSFSGIGAAALDLLAARDWPGNVRQLETLMRRIVVMFPGGEVTPAMLEAADFEPVSRAAPTPIRPAVLPLWRQEQRIIEEAIESFAGNIALAAAALELSPSTIYRKRQAWAEMDKRGAA
jgi:two-component system repressor protein LuxO